MSIEIRVPALGESITEATVGKWFKKAGEAVKADEPLVELETDKVTVEVPAPASGVLGDIVADSGTTVEVGAVLAAVKDGVATDSAPAESAETEASAKPETKEKEALAQEAAGAEPAAAPKQEAGDGAPPPPSPAARKALEESGLNASDVNGSGRRGQVLKEDVQAATASQAAEAESTASAEPMQQKREQAVVPMQLREMRLPSSSGDEAREKRVKMSRLRQTIARRLKDAQNTAAMLTTFNDVDMSAIMAMRKQYKDVFEKRYGVKLGFVGLFVKACIQALRDVPAVNAEVDGDELIYKNYYHIGVAVGTAKGLVVPVVRDADQMRLAEIEQTISDFGVRARDGKLSINEMQGGTFTISNGGVYGSLMSTPILNAPQSGILGMHRIEQRPVAINGEIVARPMMYLALSYDHRIVDGKEAVTFLVRIKECLEDPQRFILEL